jgi:hypothetical protein
VTVGRSRNLFLPPTPSDADPPLLRRKTSLRSLTPSAAAPSLAVLGKRKQNPRSLAPPRRHPRRPQAPRVGFAHHRDSSHHLFLQALIPHSTQLPLPTTTYKIDTHTHTQTPTRHWTHRDILFTTAFRCPLSAAQIPAAIRHRLHATFASESNDHPISTPVDRHITNEAH